MDNLTVDLNKLVNLFLPQQWQKRCEIIPDYVAPFAKEGTKPGVHVRYSILNKKYPSFLRYSNGPLQGFF